MSGKALFNSKSAALRSRLILLTLAHLLLGVAISFYPGIAYYVGNSVILLGVAHIILRANGENQAALWAAYLVGLEILLRMTGGFLVWEAGKYGVVLFLTIGILVEKAPRPLPFAIILYGLLLLPSFAVVSFPDFDHFRKDVSFNLSGPLTIVVASLYFYKRPINNEVFFDIGRFVLYPIVSMVVYLTLVTPELSEIEYGTQSNFRASGGFGPNQVSSVLGLGIFLVGMSLYYKRRITGYLLTDALILLVFLVRGLVTFSRGGMLGGVLAVLLLVLLNLVFAHRIWSVRKTLAFGALALALIVTGWNYVNDISEKRLQYRYEGYNFRTGQRTEITSGRLTILENEIQLFSDNIVFGVGPGMVREVNIIEKGPANTHSEYSRTVAEHGLFGVVALLILIVTPIRNILRKPKVLYPILFAILTIVFFTMFHSAMRIAMPGFFYGLAYFSPSRN